MMLSFIQFEDRAPDRMQHVVLCSQCIKYACLVHTILHAKYVCLMHMNK